MHLSMRPKANDASEADNGYAEFHSLAVVTDSCNTECEHIVAGAVERPLSQRCEVSIGFPSQARED